MEYSKYKPAYITDGGSKKCIVCKHLLPKGNALFIKAGDNQLYLHVECKPAELVRWVFLDEDGTAIAGRLLKGEPRLPFCIGKGRWARRAVAARLFSEFPEVEQKHLECFFEHDGLRMGEQRRRTAGHGYSGGDGFATI